VNNKIEFINNVWISSRGKLLDRILWFLGWIFLIGNIGIIAMEGIGGTSIFMILFVIALLFIVRRNIKNSGKYIRSKCIVTFADEMVFWEYPNIDMHDGKGICRLIYTVPKEYINSVALSKELNSIRFACCPLIQSVYHDGKERDIDCRIKRKECVLIAYNCDIYELRELFEKHTDEKVRIFD